MKGCTFSTLLWKTSLEDVPKKILGKDEHSRNFFGKILSKNLGKYVGKH